MFKERKLLRKQLERLAEQSGTAIDEELVALSTVVAGIYRELWLSAVVLIALFSFVGLELLIGILILIK